MTSASVPNASACIPAPVKWYVSTAGRPTSGPSTTRNVPTGEASANPGTQPTTSYVPGGSDPILPPSAIPIEAEPPAGTAEALASPE